MSPRWYYNLNHRISKSRSTEGNAGNFVAFQASLQPNWFYISNQENLRVANQLVFDSKWGIRRNIGKDLNYEVGAGVGYVFTFNKTLGYEFNDNFPIIQLHLRFGFKFAEKK